MEKKHMDFREAFDQSVKRQAPFIYSSPSERFPGKVEMAYDLSSIAFRAENGGVCGVSLTEEARQDIREYIETLKRTGLCVRGSVRHPPGDRIPEYYDRGSLLGIPEKEELTVARELEGILRNPYNWVLEDWGKDVPEIQRMLEAKREEWKREKTKNEA